MNEEEFLEFCRDKDTQVTLLESGHDPVCDESPAQDFAYKLHDIRRKQNRGNGNRVFLAFGGTTLGQLSYSLKYAIHAQNIGYDSIKPIIVGSKLKVRKAKQYIDQSLKILDKFNSFDEVTKVLGPLEEYIKLSLELYIPSTEEPLSRLAELRDREEFQEESLEDILGDTDLDTDASDEDVRKKIERRNLLADEVKKHLDKLNPQLSLGMYLTLSGSIKESMKSINGSKDSWTLNRYKALLASMKEHIYLFKEKEKIQEVLANATSIYAGGGNPGYAIRNLKQLGGIEWIRDVIAANKIPWQGYSMGSYMALDGMNILIETEEDENDRKETVVEKCHFESAGKGLGLFRGITLVVHGEAYLPNMLCQDLPWQQALERVVVPELQHKGEAFVYINNATIVKAENNGRREYRAFVGANSAVLFYFHGKLLQAFGPGQTQLDVHELNSRISIIREQYKREKQLSA